MASKKRRPGPGEENRHRRQKLVSSFANAWQGIVACFVEERNIKIHFLVAVLVMIFGFIITAISGPLQKAIIRIFSPIIFAAIPAQRSIQAQSVSCRSAATGRSSGVASLDFC